MAERNVHKEFSYNRLLRIDPKTIHKDRLLVNILPKLKFQGAPPTSLGNPDDFDDVYEIVFKKRDFFVGFSDYPDVVRKWLKDEVMDVINRGKATKEKFGSLRPFTLNSYKASNKNNQKDYGISDQIYALLAAFDRENNCEDGKGVVNLLTNFLSEGHDPTIDKIVISNKLELLESIVAGIVNEIVKDFADQRKKAIFKYPPLCIGQARLLSNDIIRILGYKNVMSKSAILNALVQVMFLHIGIYVLRLSLIVPDIVEEKNVNRVCQNCPVKADSIKGFEKCPYQVKFQLDFSRGYSSELAYLSRQSVDHHERQIVKYIENHFYIKKLASFLEENRLVDIENYSIVDIFRNLSEEEKYKQDVYFSTKIESLMSIEEEHKSYFGKGAFERYVQLVNTEYNSFYFGFFKRLLSSLFSKNDPDGILIQAVSHKKYNIGSELLDTLVHIASIEERKSKYKTRVMRVDEFIKWLEVRYGFYISQAYVENNIPNILRALRNNEKLFISKLQEIGYYQPISDAYYTQWLIPRYEVKEVLL